MDHPYLRTLWGLRTSREPSDVPSKKGVLDGSKRQRTESYPYSFLVAAVMSYHKLRGLQSSPVLQVRSQNGSHWAKIKLSSLSEVPRENLSPCHSSSLVKNSLPFLPMQEAKELQVRPLGWEEPLEKETATHSSILSWEIPWTEEPVGL